MSRYLPCPICHGVESCDHTFAERRLRRLALEQKRPGWTPTVRQATAIYFGCWAVVFAVMWAVIGWLAR